MKAMTITFAAGFSELFTSWQIYAMVTAGALGMFLLWGVTIFNEQVRLGWYVLGEVFCAGVIVAAVIALARSPLLSGADSPSEEDGDHHERAPVSASEPA
jgi:hypothetical protein